MAAALDWSHKITDIPDAGLAQERIASEGERKALAAALGLLSLDEFGAKYRITALAGGGYRLAGKLAVELKQPCVVSLEPVAQSIDEQFDVEFWPQVALRDEAEEAGVLDEEDVEQLTGGDIPVGRILFETLSASLDPYPRSPEAVFDWHDATGTEGQKTNPFAVLSKLKDKG